MDGAPSSPVSEPDPGIRPSMNVPSAPSGEKNGGSGVPALVACLCAVATVLALAGYRQVRNELDTLTAEWRKTRQHVDDLSAQLAVLQRENAEQRQTLAQEQTRREQWEKRIAQNNAWSMTQEADFPPTATPITATQYADDPLRVEATALTTAPSARALSAPDDGGVATGVILAVSTRWERVLVGRGRNDGWNAKELVTVVRNGRFVGELEIQEPVYDDMVLCRPVGALALRVGDRVLRDESTPLLE